MPPSPSSSPSPEDRPDDDLRRLAEQAVAAVVGDSVADADAGLDPATTRRITVVVDAIETAGEEARS